MASIHLAKHWVPSTTARSWRSPKVAGAGCFGASLMLEPELVAACCTAMAAVTSVPITVKCRLGAPHTLFKQLLQYRSSPLYLSMGISKLVAAGSIELTYVQQQEDVRSAISLICLPTCRH